MKRFLLALLVLTILPVTYATSACILSTGECFNTTESSASGPSPGYYDGSQTQCTATPPAGLGGTYVTPDEEDLNLIPACQGGCCCDAQPHASIRSACNAANYAARIAGDDASCRLTCNTPAGQTACGEGIVSQAEFGCFCGSSQGLVNDYCCWNGKMALNANACDPLPATQTCLATDATHNYPITQSCWCGGTTINNGVCCDGLVQKNTQAECAATGPIATTCGDGIKQAPEQCDASNAQALNNVDCGGSGWLCTASCTCLNVATQTGSYPNGVCDAGENPTTNPLDCAQPISQCSIAYASPPSPTNVVANYDPNTNAVTITWINPIGCTSNRISHEIRRSSVSGALALSSPEITPVSLAPATATYIDNALPASTTVLYYQLVTYYQVLDANNNPRTMSVSVSMQVNKRGALCPIANTEYCLDPYTKVECTNYQPTSTTCVNSLCVITGSQAQCQSSSSQCDQCNGLFASFVDDSKNICVSGSGSGCSLAACEDVTTCYKDLKDTSVPLYQGCANVNSCTNYRTQQACVANTCGKPGQCEWDSLSGSAGGICKPSDATFAKCGDCDSLGASCTQTACEAISTSCFYNDMTDDAINSVSRCVDKSQMVCEYLGTPALCENGRQFSLDVKYVGGVRVNTTNDIKSTSNDYAGLGKCAWSLSGAANKCTKDSDNNGARDDTTFNPTITLAKKLQLLRDFTPPVTSVLSPAGSTYPKTVSFDISNPEPNSKVHACLVSQGQDCYPNAPLSDPYMNTFLTGGTYDLHFYAEDESHNLEPVKTFRFNIDTSEPNYTNVNITATLVRQQGTLKALATLSFDTLEPAQCTSRLLNASGSPLPQSALGKDLNNNPYTELNAFGQKFSVTYMLDKNIYNVNITCVDAIGNTNKDQGLIPIIADTDLTIYNLLPYMTAPIKSGAVQISADTQADANCRYGPIGQQYANMQDFTVTGAKHHTKNIVAPSGMSEYTVACDFNGRVEYEDTSRIRILVDDQAPTTIACDNVIPANGACGTLFNVSLNSGFGLFLSCQDNPSSGAFGCRAKYWCIDDGNGCSPQEYKLYNGLGIPVPLGVENDTKVWVWSADNGFNYETPWPLIVSTRDRQPPAEPTFTVQP